MTMKVPLFTKLKRLFTKVIRSRVQPTNLECQARAADDNITIAVVASNGNLTRKVYNFLGSGRYLALQQYQHKIGLAPDTIVPRDIPVSQSIHITPIKVHMEVGDDGSQTSIDEPIIVTMGEDMSITHHKEATIVVKKEPEEKMNIREIDTKRRKKTKENEYFKGYKMKFSKEWSSLPKFKGWLSPGSSPGKVKCLSCNKDLVGGKSELLRHAETAKHIKRRKEFEREHHSKDLDSLGNFGPELHMVDMRSDTVTLPSPEMKEAMMNAAMGDDCFGEDPTVKELEEKVASLMNKEAALYMPSGTMANLVCVLSHCWEKGSEVILGHQSYLNVWAQGGIAQVGSVQHHTIKNEPDGTFSLGNLRALVQRDDSRWPGTQLVCVENPHNMAGGKVLPSRWMDQLGAYCHELSLTLHMDGARLLNASVASGVPVSHLVQHCDSIALCLNKGLGAPVGSVVAGNKEFIAKALHVRRMLGGNLHQVGMFAAAGIHALDHATTTLSKDHEYARTIAQGINETLSSAVTVDLDSVQTNVILINCDKVRVTAMKLCQRLSAVSDTELEELDEHIVVLATPLSESVVRLMTHCNMTEDDVQNVVRKFKVIIQEYDNVMFIEYKINIPEATVS